MSPSCVELPSSHSPFEARHQLWIPFTASRVEPDVLWLSWHYRKYDSTYNVFIWLWRKAPSYRCNDDKEGCCIWYLRCSFTPLHGSNDLQNLQRILWKTTFQKLPIDIIGLNLQLNTSIIRKMSILSPCLRISKRMGLFSGSPPWQFD